MNGKIGVLVSFMKNENKDECEEIFQSIRTSFNKFLRYTKKYTLTILSLVIIL